MCGAPQQGLCKAPHDSGVCWKQFTMLLEEVSVCDGVSFDSPCTSRVDEGVRVGSAHCQGGLPVYYGLISSVVLLVVDYLVQQPASAGLLFYFLDYCQYYSSITNTSSKQVL